MSDEGSNYVSEVDGEVRDESTSGSPAGSENEGHVEEQVVFVVEIPQTDEPRVDAALAALSDVDPSAPADAVGPLNQVYERLHRVLTQP